MGNRTGLMSRWKAAGAALLRLAPGTFVAMLDAVELAAIAFGDRQIKKTYLRR
ncbi:MAG: hypothetical protein M3Q39_11235 [Actinomycetota bacterium]|nr:hypothetical protein [Actinomycetota bacterium]